MIESASMETLLTASQTLSRAARWLSTCRLLAFAAMFGAGLLGVSQPLVAWLGVPLGLIAFVVFVLWHGNREDELARIAERITLAREAGDRKSARRRPHVVMPWPASSNPLESSPLDAGLSVYREEPASITADALTADDLGIYPAVDRESSPATLFGFLNWTSTIFGARRLRRILISALQSSSDILHRQAAVKAAANEVMDRERLVASLLPLRLHNLEPIPETLRATPLFAGRDALFLWVSFTGTALPVAILTAAVLADWSWMAAIIPLTGANLLTIACHSKHSTPRRNRLLLLAPLLRSLNRLGLVLDSSRLDTADWTAIRKVLAAARPQTKRLSRWLAALGFAYYGAIFELWNLLTLWELRTLPLAEAELARNQDLIEKALGALGETEALLCLALPLVEQQGFELPTVVDEPEPVLSAKEIGHPLLEAQTAVRNPIALGAGRNVLLVTGSNMAGKSTYLKSIGLNVALACAGGPVCGTEFRLTPVEIHSDMNVRDSLDDGKSYFQVEVERVRLAIERAETTPRVLAIFDELFRGTNSTERVALARAILRHLRSTGALTIVATHDASLTRLVTEENEAGMTNAHFRESVEGRDMHFDYRLREGPATTRNAIRVLEAQGYPEGITRAARGECGEE